MLSVSSRVRNGTVTYFYKTLKTRERGKFGLTVLNAGFVQESNSPDIASIGNTIETECFGTVATSLDCSVPIFGTPSNVKEITCEPFWIIGPKVSCNGPDCYEPALKELRAVATRQLETLTARALADRLFFGDPNLADPSHNCPGTFLPAATSIGTFGAAECAYIEVAATLAGQGVVHAPRDILSKVNKLVDKTTSTDIWGNQVVFDYPTAASGNSMVYGTGPMGIGLGDISSFLSTKDLVIDRNETYAWAVRPASILFDPCILVSANFTTGFCA